MVADKVVCERWWVTKWCVKYCVCDKLWVTKMAGGGGGGGGRGGGRLQNQKQEPHTKMWGMHICICVLCI